MYKTDNQQELTVYIAQATYTQCFVKPIKEKNLGKYICIMNHFAVHMKHKIQYISIKIF